MERSPVRVGRNAGRTLHNMSEGRDASSIEIRDQSGELRLPRRPLLERRDEGHGSGASFEAPTISA